MQSLQNSSLGFFELPESILIHVVIQVRFYVFYDLDLDVISNANQM